eukprot:tig00020675_g12682.t1
MFATFAVAGGQRSASASTEARTIALCTHQPRPAGPPQPRVQVQFESSLSRFAGASLPRRAAQVARIDAPQPLSCVAGPLRPRIDQQVTFIYTDDMAGTCGWYERVLGLECELDQGAARIYRTSETSFLGICKVRPGRYVEPKGVVITFACPKAEVDQWYERMVEKGADILGPPEKNDMFHVYAFFIRDPNGYLIEFQTFLDPRWPSLMFD